MNNRIRVYVAGPYSADNVIGVFQNISRGEKVCAELFRLGFAPFCPWHDKSYIMDNIDNDFSVKDFQEQSMAWLGVSHIVLAIEGWEDSQGTLAEIKKAGILQIPVVFSIDQVVEYRDYFDQG